MSGPDREAAPRGPLARGVGARAGARATAAALAALLGLAWLHLRLQGAPDPAAQFALLTGAAPEGFAQAQYLFAAAPRAAMAMLGGAALGLAGMALQQATGNRLVSPFTLGASSGAWFALVVAAVLAPGLAGEARAAVAFAGAAAATGLAVGIAGRDGLGGLPLVLAGMAISILLGSLATGTALLNAQYVRHVFVWGAGDLTQTGWAAAADLAPRLALGAGVLALALRPLALMSLGGAGARARGLPVGPLIALTAGASLFLTASVISSTGLIGFVGLVAPNLAWAAGARRAGARMAASAGFGAAALLGADAVALLAGRWSTDLVPTGACAALVGAPALILLMRRRMGGAGLGGFRMPGRGRGLGPGRWAALGLSLAATAALAALVARSGAEAGQAAASGWRIGPPSELAWSLRWPRLLGGAAGGAGMAISGALLQRMMRNPLAGPDLLGVSSGAALALVAGATLFGLSALALAAPLALAGGVGALLLLLALGRRHGHAPGALALVGVALAALMDSAVQLVLARGDAQAQALLGWLSGSTYRLEGPGALALALAVAAALAGALLLQRRITLLSAGDALARGAGLDPARARLAATTLAAAAAAAVTAALGPIAFLGLLTPHLASLIGARRAGEQLAAAALLGAALMLGADWLGRVAVFPAQLPAGLVASALGGAGFVGLLARRRLSPAAAD